MTNDIGATFRALHVPGDPFILANAWDVGSAKMLESLGAQAIATSSAAHAFTLGRPDGGTVTRDEALAHAQDLVGAVGVPVSGDFENGFGDTPDDCAETVRLSAEVGLAGISIEDENFAAGAAYDFDLAVERIKSASAAACALPGDFVFVARADGIMNGHYGMEEALKRIKAFDEAGADCLYVPLPPGVQSLKNVVRATDKPVNALAVGQFSRLSRDDFAKAGIARISIGSALARVTHRVINDIGQDMIQNGSFAALGAAMPGGEVDDMLTR